MPSAGAELIYSDRERERERVRNGDRHKDSKAKLEVDFLKYARALLPEK